VDLSNLTPPPVSFRPAPLQALSLLKYPNNTTTFTKSTFSNGQAKFIVDAVWGTIGLRLNGQRYHIAVVSNKKRQNWN
jgi:hypothetical protein